MAGVQVDVKRYQIISLLYIIFVCFSVLNIKISSLDSNIYTIKTIQNIQVEELKKLQISNTAIGDNIDTLNTIEKSRSYLEIRSRLARSLSVVNAVIDHVNDQLKVKGLTFINQFNSRSFIEKTLREGKGVQLMEEDLFKLSAYIKSSNYKLPSRLDDLIPLKREVTTLKGRKDHWQSYLFFHKPMSISYMQLERIKLLIIQTQLMYQEAALEVIGYQAMYYSKFNPKSYKLVSTYKDSVIQNVPRVDSIAKKDTVYNSDELFKKILYALSTENVFVGFANTILHDFNPTLGKDFDMEVTPKVKVVKYDKGIRVFFTKTGEYVFKFYDLKMERKLLFEKRIYVNKIPDPVVKVKGENLNNYSITVADLLKAERLEAKVDINNINYFPGRINSFKVIRIHNGKEEEAYNNYGEIFQSPTQKVIGGLKKNDLLIFDNVSLSLVDGSTRISSPIVYKIID